MTFTCFAKDDIGAARDESPRLLYIRYNSLPYASLLLLFSPNLHGTCEAADNLTIVKVGIRFPSFLPYRHFKRKRIVEDSLLDFYKRLLRVQAQIDVSIEIIYTR